MRISKVRAHNLKTFEDFEMECGDVNVCAGQNAAGKTSVLTLVTALFGNLGAKGNPRILRAGADSGEIGAIIVSDDGAESWEVYREIKPGKIETPKITSSLSGKIGSPVAWLQPLIDRISIEPISRAMNADESQQTEILLSTIPLAVDTAELTTAVAGVDVPGLAAHLKNAVRMPSGLDAIAAVHKSIYDHRRDINRDAKVKEVHAAELIAGIPESAGDGAVDWKTKYDAIERDLNAKIRDEQQDRLACEKDLGLTREFASHRNGESAAAINSEIDAKIRVLEQERAERQSELAAAVQTERDKINDLHQQNIAAVTAKYRPEIEQLNGGLTLARKNWDDQTGHDRTRAIAMQNSREAGLLQEKSDAMTAALDNLDKLQLSLLGKLDKEIRGLRVENGVISINGVPLSELNTAERAKFWIRIAAMRAGELGVVVMDGAECFDDKQFQAVVQAALGTGLQWFFGRVTSEKFSVKALRAEEYIAA